MYPTCQLHMKWSYCKPVKNPATAWHGHQVSFLKDEDADFSKVDGKSKSIPEKVTRMSFIDAIDASELQSKSVKKNYSQNQSKRTTKNYNYIQPFLQFLLFSSQVNVTLQLFCSRLRSFNHFEIDLAKANTTNLFRRNTNLWIRQLRATGFCCLAGPQGPKLSRRAMWLAPVMGKAVSWQPWIKQWAGVMTMTGWNCGNLLWLLRSRQWG